jgi:hypothetical protein
LTPIARALVRDQAIHLSRQLACHWDKAMRDLDNRLSGVAAGFQNLTHSQPVSDEVLEERVRSKLGRSVSHPRAIDISVRDGRVTLRGPVLAGCRVSVMSKTSSKFTPSRAIYRRCKADQQGLAVVTRHGLPRRAWGPLREAWRQ